MKKADFVKIIFAASIISVSFCACINKPANEIQVVEKEAPAEDKEQEIKQEEKVQEPEIIEEEENEEDAQEAEREREIREKAILTYNAFKAYKTVLQNNSQSIKEYDYMSREENCPIAIVDVFGDDIPELIYMESRNNKMDIDLHIDTYIDGSVCNIFLFESLDNLAGGSSGYYLYQEKGKGLGLFLFYGGEVQERTFYKLVEEDGLLIRKAYLQSIKYPDYYGTPNSFVLEDNEITEMDYDKQAEAIHKETKNILLANAQLRDEDQEFVSSKNYIGMTYDDAIAYIDSQLAELDSLYSISSGNEGPDFSIFSEITPDYAFSSGAGGWGTEIHINSDGTFTGYYYDTDAGLNGEGFDGTTHYSDFYGSFSQLTQINDYTYSMELESLEYKDPIGDEYIEPGDYRMKYISTEAYGIDGGHTFYVFMKGAPVSELPEEFVDWVKMPYILKDETELPFYGFYNVDEKYGFFSVNRN